MRRRQESGQVLVGTLVIMILVFAMAGSLALAVTSLLDRQTSHRSAVDNDLRAADALAAAAAIVAGHGVDSNAHSTCGTQDPEIYAANLPGPFKSSVSCRRFDEVSAPPDLRSVVLPWSSNCATVILTDRGHVWLFLSALGGSGMTAWIDGSTACNVSNAPSAGCHEVLAPAGVVHLALGCELTAQTHTLHLRTPLSSPAAARVVGSSVQSDNGHQDRNNPGQSQPGHHSDHAAPHTTVAAPTRCPTRPLRGGWSGSAPSLSGCSMATISIRGHCTTPCNFRPCCRTAGFSCTTSISRRSPVAPTPRAMGRNMFSIIGPTRK